MHHIGIGTFKKNKASFMVVNQAKKEEIKDGKRGAATKTRNDTPDKKRPAASKKNGNGKGRN